MKPEMLQKHPPGPFRDQWQEKASVRTHASLCSKEEENSMTRAAVCVRVCVCACVCVQACESAHRIAVPYTSWPPYSVQGLSAAIRQAHVWPQPRACFPLHPYPRLGAEAQADEATQTRPLCAGSGGSITRGLYPSSAPPPPGRTAWELLFTLG